MLRNEDNLYKKNNIYIVIIINNYSVIIIK